MNSKTNIGKVFQEVNNRLNLADVATRLGAKLDKLGDNFYQGTCPTGHPSENGRSFSVNTKLGIFHCFSCEIAGDATELVEKVTGKSKWESLKWLISEYHLNIQLSDNFVFSNLTTEEIKEREIFYARSLVFEKIYEIGKQMLYEDVGKEALNYLTEDRGYKFEILKNTEWIFFPKNYELRKLITEQFPEMNPEATKIKLQGHFGDNFRLAFPYRNKNGKITGFLKRATISQGMTVTTFDGKKHENIRWDSTPGLKKDDLFGLDKVVNSDGTIITVEGYPDAIYLREAGIKNITAIGQGIISKNHLKGLRDLKIKNVIISFDNDSVGPENTEKAVLMIIESSNITPYVIDPSEYGSHKDPDEYFKANGFDALKNILETKMVKGIIWVVNRIIKDYASLSEIDKNNIEEQLFELLQLIRDDKTISELHEILSKDVFKVTLPAFKKLIKSKRDLKKDEIIKSMVEKPIVPFIDMNTNARCYYRSIDDNLSLGVDEKIIEEIMLDHGLKAPNFYPAFQVVFNPQEVEKKFDLFNKTFNLFTPTDFMLKEKNNEKIDLKKSCPRINDLINNLIPVDDEREHFFNWLSFTFSTREKARSAWVFKGIQGSGKNLFFDKIIKPLFGPNQTIVVDDDRLQSDFNGFMNNKLFVAFNEVANDETRTKRSVKSKIKALITDSTIIVNEKHVKTYEINNFANALFFSNEVIPLLIEEKDRRFNVVRTGGILKEVKSFRDDKKLFVKNLSEELSEFAQYLLNYNYDIDLVDEVLENDAKSEIKELSMNRFELFAVKLKNKDWDWFDENFPKEDTGFLNIDNRNGLMTEVELNSGEVLRDTLLKSYNAINDGEVSVSKLTRQLRLYGVNLKRKKRLGRSDEHYYNFN